MSMRQSIFAATLVLVLAPGYVQAQGADIQPQDRFFANKVREERDTSSLVQVRLISSTFALQEIGDSVFNQTQEVADNASPVTRLYTELRAQLDAVTGGADGWKVRADARGRFNLPCTFQTKTDNPNVIGTHPELGQCRTQSGTFGANEYDVRELYAQRSGDAVDIRGGRLYVAEAAATKIDGVRAQYALDGNWSLIGFGGLAPSRISRSLVEDYDGGVLPIALGAAGAYRYGGYFGSVGAAGIVPISTQNADAAIQPRTFVTSNGYWRPSALLDVYHFVSVDVSGPSTEELSDLFTNVSLGLNVKPTDDLRVTAALHHFSTDALQEFALERLEQQNPNQGVIQNNVEVLRTTAQSARLGVSMALMEKRFEVSTSFALRHRLPETVCPSDNLSCDPTMGESSLDAWSGEAMVGVVDRESIGGLRLGASLINMFGLYTLGIGDESYGRSNFLVARLDASRELMDGQMQVDADVAYQHAEDIGASSCANGIDTTLICYGGTFVNTISGGGTLFYRFSPDWFGLLTGNVALQPFQPDARAENPDQGPFNNTLLTMFLRVAYRF